MKDDPLVSIVLPAYNAEKFIGIAIQSIIDQSYQNWELVVCDDASIDNTKDIINELALRDSRILISNNSKNLKLLKTRNRLLKLTKGDYITFQDADDISHSDRIRLMVNEFLSNKNLGLLSSQVQYINKDGKVLHQSNKPTTFEKTKFLIRMNNVIGGSIMMIKRSALAEVGFKFREYFDGLSYQDYDLSTLIVQKYEAYCLPQVLYYYRQLETSASKIVDHRRILAKEIVIHLAKQRRDTGTDDLMNGDVNSVDEYFQKLEVPFKRDPSLVYRKYAANFMYNQLYKKAISTSWAAIKKRPTKWVNWMTLQYCVRKTILSYFGHGV